MCSQEKKILRRSRAEGYCSEDSIAPLASSWPWESQGRGCTGVCARADTRHEARFTLTPSGPGAPLSPSSPGSPCETETSTVKLCPHTLFPRAFRSRWWQRAGLQGQEPSPAL